MPKRERIALVACRLRKSRVSLLCRAFPDNTQDSSRARRGYGHSRKDLWQYSYSGRYNYGLVRTFWIASHSIRRRLVAGPEYSIPADDTIRTIFADHLTVP
jgi:hypothetical protein